MPLSYWLIEQFISATPSLNNILIQFFTKWIYLNKSLKSASVTYFIRPSLLIIFNQSESAIYNIIIC